jgi:hypothetical protein
MGSYRGCHQSLAMANCSGERSEQTPFSKFGVDYNNRFKLERLLMLHETILPLFSVPIPSGRSILAGRPLQTGRFVQGAGGSSRYIPAEPLPGWPYPKCRSRINADVPTGSGQSVE